MGTKKTGILDKTKEGEKKGLEATDTGAKIEGDGREIKSLLDSIDTSMDEDDVAKVTEANSGYGADFKSAFSEQVETKEAEMEKTEQQAINDATTERTKVNAAADKFAQASGVSDIGRKNADGGAEKMRSSAEEYDSMQKSAEDIINETKSRVSSLKSSVSGIFG